MCEIVDQFIAQGIAEGEARGKAEGIAEGQNNIVLLMSKLFSQNRADDAKKAVKDKVFLAELMKQYGFN